MVIKDRLGGIVLTQSHGIGNRTNTVVNITIRRLWKQSQKVRKLEMEMYLPASKSVLLQLQAWSFEADEKSGEFLNKAEEKGRTATH